MLFVRERVSKLSNNQKEAPEGGRENFLGTAPVGSLVAKFAVPSIIAMLVGAIYNIVDQIFIGQFVGTLGNAATNISFPLVTSCIALALLFGIGGASNFNLAMGRKQVDDAAFYIGNALTGAVVSGVLICIIVQLFMNPILMLFGATEDVLPFTVEYVRVVSIGFPFLILTTSGGHIIRADGSPKVAMFSNMIGAVLNVGLDALFVAVLGMGMAGAAWATIIGQIISGIIVVMYCRKYKTVHLGKEHLIPRAKYFAKIVSLGVAAFFNQVAMMITQIALNNALKIYGGMSFYGAEITIAVAGVVMKVTQLFFSVVIGIVQGSQPIFGYNYGAKKYERVRQAYKIDLVAGFAISALAFALFQLIPRQLLSIFGTGTEEYFQFGENFFRIFVMGILINFVQVISSTFFTSIGKAYKGVFLSLTRQIIYLLPLIIILPMSFGLDGLLFAGPVADLGAFVTAIIMMNFEFKKIKVLEKERDEANSSVVIDN